MVASKLGRPARVVITACTRRCSRPGSCACTSAGKVTNDAKGIFDGVSVTTFALGTAELYHWLDDNADVAFLPVDVVNDPTVIGRNRKLVSINGALCIDLYGQVVADNIDGKQISGVGGHEDFVAGAELHVDAHSLICLTSTATWVAWCARASCPRCPDGAVVSTPRHHTGVVVTEYGSAELAGLTVRERARRWPTSPIPISEPSCATRQTASAESDRDGQLTGAGSG